MGMVNDGLGIVKDHGKMFGAIKGTVVQNFMDQDLQPGHWWN